MIEAKIIKDSISPRGNRLISIETKAPKFLDAEIEKHRMISSNSSSSRAIPVSRTDTSFIPTDVRLNEKGMQGYTKMPHSDYGTWIRQVEFLKDVIITAVSDWDKELKIHKQHLNRFLEPFTWQYKIMTANLSQWHYFLALRLAEDADPNIQQLARSIKNKLDESEPQFLVYGDWHLPYVDSFKEEDRMISAARCARTSYKTHEGKDPTREEDMALAKFLIQAKHLTPFEHQATPMNLDDIYPNMYIKNGHRYSGNLRDWSQYRQYL